MVYEEGVFVGYRGYERAGTKPLFPFGSGLSCTTFKYSNLSIKLVGLHLIILQTAPVPRRGFGTMLSRES
jgi:beta-glucosidase